MKKKETQPGLIYVIQKHRSSHLHYDLRLEENDLLKSWALPKEPPTEPEVKRLAIEVEDHPLGYENFECQIPEDEYEAGTVEIWDRGTYKPLRRTNEFIEIQLFGRQLRGIYTLVKIKDKKKGQPNLWLFFKNKNQKSARKKNSQNEKT